MEKRFVCGDKVRVIMADNTMFGRCEVEAVINHMPSDTGDCIHIIVDGAIVLINPMAGDFTGMVKLADGE